MYHPSILILCLSLTACSSASTLTDSSVIPGVENDDSGSDGFAIDTGAVPGIDVGEIADLENAIVFVTGDGQVETINNDRKTDITIAGLNHTINIESNIGTLSINGSNSILRFADNVTVDICNVAGNDNTAERTEYVVLDCLVEGLGNSGFD